MTRLPDWRRIIRPKNNTEYLKHRDGDTQDIINVVMYADTRSAQFIDSQGVELLRGANNYETCRNVWQFVRSNLRYRADVRGHERVKSPGALFSVGTGDCKSYSVAEGALLRALGIPFKFRFTAYKRGDFTHVYVVARAAGRWVPMDAIPNGGFDSEVAYLRKEDISPADQPGIAGIAGGNGRKILGLAAAVFVGWQLAKHWR